MSDSVRPHRQQPTRLPRPWDSPGKNTGVGCHFVLQWNTATMEYYSAIKKNETMPFAATWMDLEIVTLSELSQR